MGAEDLLVLREVAATVATEAAALVRARRLGEVEVTATKSTATDVVTATDQESEALLRRRLADLRPEDGFLGEEGGASASRSSVTWVVDPVDGTVNFLYGLGHYAVSVAAAVPLDALPPGMADALTPHGRDPRTDLVSVAGAVVDVTTGAVFTASWGGGATRDGLPLRVRPVPALSQRLVLTGFGYDAAQRRIQGAAVAQLLVRVRDIRRMGSAALDLCALASGQADAYLEEGLNHWDHAAAALVATEAGARVGFLPGAGGLPCVLAAPAASYDELVSLAAECGFLSGA